MGFDRFSRLASIPALVLAALVWTFPAAPTAAAGLLRDADIEHGLGLLAAPVLVAAELSPRRVKVMVVDDPSLNAFVLDNSTIYLHAGMILKAQNAAMLQAVIAHEAAHISNGHVSRRMHDVAGARTAAGLGMALAMVAVAAGGGDAAGGIALGVTSSALRGFLAHTRAEEAAADRSASAYLLAAGVDPRGMVALHELFRGQEMLSVDRQDPYMQSHPLTSDRIRVAADFVAAHPAAPVADAEDEYWFDRAQGKLSAFLRAPKWTLLRMAEDRHADVRLMREAVARHRQADLAGALAAIDAALALRPDDPYYLDLKGQILVENRRFDAAVATYARAVDLAPREPLIQADLGHALLAAGRPKQAIAALETARSNDFRNPRALRDMALAYAATGQTGLAALSTAERYALDGNLADAGPHARRAVALLPRGSAAWQRAQDVLIASDKATKGKK